MTHQVLDISVNTGSGRMKVYTKVMKCSKGNEAQVINGLRNEIVGSHTQGCLQASDFLGDGFFNPFLIQLLVDSFRFQASFDELAERIRQVGKELQVIVCRQVVGTYFINPLSVIADSKQSGGDAFAMEIPMGAFRKLGHEIEYKVRNLYISLEFVEIKRLLCMYEDRCVHVAKIRLLSEDYMDSTDYSGNRTAKSV